MINSEREKIGPAPTRARLTNKSENKKCVYERAREGGGRGRGESRKRDATTNVGRKPGNYLDEKETKIITERERERRKKREGEKLQPRCHSGDGKEHGVA